MTAGAEALALHPLGFDAPLAQPGVVPPPPVPASLLDPFAGGALVWIAELEAARDGGTLPVAGPALGETALGLGPFVPAPAGGAEVIRLSDLGWRAREDAPGGGGAYPPFLLEGPDFNRGIGLAPAATDTVSVGSIVVAAGRLGVSFAGRDTALRPVRVRVGQQGWDWLRAMPTDPPAAALAAAFQGLALSWRGGERGTEIPLRDPTAWLDQPITVARFLGTGGAQGPAEMAGTPVPVVRGGSALAPVRACPARLVWAAGQVYRWSDQAAGVAALLEDGAPVYTAAGQVADVFAASPAAGSFVWDAAGFVRLGSVPQGQITVDGWAGSSPLAAVVLRGLLVDTLGLPPGLLDEGSVLAAAAVAPWQGGWAWTGEETGREAIRPLLAALGGRLVPTRGGGLRLWPLRALPPSARPVARLDGGLAVDVAPVPLDGLMPPAASWTVGYGRTHTTTTSPKPTVSAADRERLAQPWRTQGWSNAANLARYAQATRPALVETALLVQADALNCANALGALWGEPRALWRVELPAAAVLARDIGDVVTLAWDAEGLRAGALGQVVGDSVRAGEPTGALLVLT